MSIFTEISNLYKEIKERHEHHIQVRMQNAVVHSPKRMDSIKDVKLLEEQEKEIDQYYLENYGEKIDHTCHRTYYAYSGIFDKTYFPEQLFIPEFEHYMNHYQEYNLVLQDKNIMPMIAESLGIKVPTNIASCNKGYFTDAHHNHISLDEVITILNNNKEFFIKRTVDSCGGAGCMHVINDGGKDKTTSKSFHEIISLFGEDFVIQKCLHCHPSISVLHPNSVNTFRIMTYRWKNSICLANFVLRMGVGEMSVDNASSGGLFVGVNPSGELLPVAMTVFGERYTHHPTSGTRFEGHIIPGFNRIVNSAILLHNSLPQLGVAHWDFTIDEDDNVVLIEGNLRGGGIRMGQMAHGKGLFGERTAEILQWTRKMKHMSIRQRKNHTFGR